MTFSYNKTNSKVTVLIFFILFSSCNFRIIKEVGPQYSSSMKWSKEFKVYRCAYRPDNDSKSKHLKYSIDEIFAEYQYTHDGGLFSGFMIDKNSNQIIITDSSKFTRTWSSDSCSFNYKGFETRNGHFYYKQINNSISSDTLKLKIVIEDFNTNKKETDSMIYIKEL